MRNFQTFKLNHDFRASYLQHRPTYSEHMWQTEFSISIMITTQIFSSSACVCVCVCLSEGFSHLGCSRKKLYPVIPLFLDEGNHQLKPRFHQPNYVYDKYSGTCFQVDQTKNNIGLIFVPPQNSVKPHAFCMDHARQISPLVTRLQTQPKSPPILKVTR